ncbi:MFS transporter [Sorangium sp. So ce693]|uniref:MFS transporter n=2 Tax=unclassified Sorangium TaxID=2621164 RepID=UPI003F5E0AC3
MKRPARARLSSAERRLLLLLGAPGLGLSLSLTVISTYLPVLARGFTGSRAGIGALVGGEGLVALLVPLWIGGFSDRVHTRFGRRVPFLMATAPVAAVALALIPLARSLPVMAVEVSFFYAAYFTYLAPYRALYADLVPVDLSGRAQGIQGIFSQVGLGSALVGGGLLLELWRPLPYLVAAAALLLGTVLLVLGLRGTAGPPAVPQHGSRSPAAEVWALLRDHRAIRALMIANALLSLTLGGLKAFVVLWLTEGLGKSMKFIAGAMTVVAVGALIGTLVSGHLADRHGAARVLARTLVVFGLGLALPAFSSSTILLGAELPLIAFCGGAASTLPYAILMQRMPARSHGAAAGLFDVSGGIGTLLGPALTGAAIDLLRPLFASTKGYAAMWLVLSASTLASVAMLRRARSG